MNTIKSPAEADQTMPQEHRWNWQEREDGVYFCEGGHPRGSDCEWQKYQPSSHKSESAGLSPTDQARPEWITRDELIDRIKKAFPYSEIKILDWRITGKVPHNGVTRIYSTWEPVNMEPFATPVAPAPIESEGLTKADLDQMAELAERATQGPWTMDPDAEDYQYAILPIGDCDAWILDKQDAEFITRARTFVPLALKELDRQEQVIQQKDRENLRLHETIMGQAVRLDKQNQEIDRLKKYACPLGMDDNRQLCSAATCTECQLGRLKQIIAERDREIESLKAEHIELIKEINKRIPWAR